MSAKKGYKSVPWLFGKEIEIPEKWELANFESFTKKITYGFTNPMPTSNEGAWMITATNIKNGKIVYETARKTSREAYDNLITTKSRPKKDLILITKDGTLGEVAVVDREDICINQSVASIDYDNSKISSDYLLLSLQSKLIKQFIDIFSPQTTIRHIYITDIPNWKIPLPPLPEQQKIATILSNVDSLIQSTSKIIENSKSLKTGLMQKLLTRGIGHTKFKKVPWYFGKEIEIPYEWELTTLKETSYITDGSHASPPKTDNGLPMATVENIQDSIIDIDSCYKISKEDFEQLVKNNCKPEINDVLFTKDGTVGKSLVFTQNVDVVLLSSIAILKPFDKLDSVYLHYSFHSEAIIKFIAKYLGGTAIKRIVLKNLEKFLFPLPPLPEQEKIATILSNIDSQIQSQTQYKDKLEKLKKSLMQKLLTGEVRV